MKLLIEQSPISLQKEMNLCGNSPTCSANKFLSAKSLLPKKLRLEALHEPVIAEFKRPLHRSSAELLLAREPQS